MATPRKTAAPKPAETKAVDKPKTHADKKREAYSAAQTTLRKRHLAEFRELCVEEGEKRGIKYEFTPTPEERAAELLRKTLQEFPQLRDTLVGQQQDTEPVAPETVS